MGIRVNQSSRRLLFWFLFCATILASISVNLFYFCSGIIILKTSNSVLLYSFVLFLSTIPAVIFYPIIDYVINKISQFLIIFLTLFLTAIIISVTALLEFYSSLNAAFIYVSVASLSLTSMFFLSLFQAILPAFIDKSKMNFDNGMYDFGLLIAYVSAPLVGALIMTYLNNFTLFASAVILLLCALAVTFLIFVKITIFKVKNDLLHKIKDLRNNNNVHLFTNKSIIKAILILSLLSSSVSIVQVVLTPAIMDSYGTMGLGVILFMSGIGMFLGVVAMKFVNIQNPSEYIYNCSIVQGSSIIVAAIYPGIVQFSLAIIIFFYFLAAQNSLTRSYIQINSAKRILPQILAFKYMILQLTIAVSYLIGGFLGQFSKLVSLDLKPFFFLKSEIHNGSFIVTALIGVVMILAYILRKLLLGRHCCSKRAQNHS